MALVSIFIQILVAFQLMSMIPFIKCTESDKEPSSTPSPNPTPKNDDPHGKRPMESEDDDQQEMRALIGGLNLNMPHFENLMHGQQHSLQHGAAAGPSSSFAVDHQQQSTSAIPHHHLPNLHMNAGIPQHMGGMGPNSAAASEHDETRLFIQHFREFLSSIPQEEECQLPAEGEDVGPKEPDSASVDRQNAQSVGGQNVRSILNALGGMEGSSRRIANYTRSFPAAFSSNPAPSSNVVQVGVDPAHTSLPLNIWARQMMFPSLRQFVTTVLFPGPEQGQPMTQFPLPMLPKMPKLQDDWKQNIENPAARQWHNAKFGRFSYDVDKKKYRNLINIMEEETGKNTVADKTIIGILDDAFEYVRYMQWKIIMDMIDQMLMQENPVFSYHSILVWNQWYPQHKLPGTEHVSALVRRRRQQQPEPPPTPKRPRRGKRGNKRVRKWQQQQQIGDGRNGMDLDKLSCYIVRLRSANKQFENDGKAGENF